MTTNGKLRDQFKQLPQILVLFLTGAGIVTILVRQYAPDLFLILLRTHSRTWAAMAATNQIQFKVERRGNEANTSVTRGSTR